MKNRRSVCLALGASLAIVALAAIPRNAFADSTAQAKATTAKKTTTKKPVLNDALRPSLKTDGAGPLDLPRLPKGPLARGLTVVDIPVAAAIDLGSGYDNPSSFWNGQGLRPIILAPQPDQGAKIGWTDKAGTIHITPINQDGVRVAADTTIKTGLLRDLVAHDDGFAALVLQNGGMYLMRVQDDKTVFHRRLISNSCRNIHMGSLAWNGEYYAAYFAIHRGGHEGDALRFVTQDGKPVDGGWSWGCSHCIDMRVVTAGKHFMPLGLSDAYPGTGFYFNHNKKRVSYTWGDHSGGTGGRIGGLAPLGDKMFLAFSSKEGGRSHWSVALANFAQKAPHAQTVHEFLDDTPADQMNVKIAPYGDDQLLVSWLEKGTWVRKFQRYDGDANPIGAREVLPVRASPRADMRTAANGDIVWAHSWGDDTSILKFVRIRNVQGNGAGSAKTTLDRGADEAR